MSMHINARWRTGHEPHQKPYNLQQEMEKKDDAVFMGETSTAPPPVAARDKIISVRMTGVVYGYPPSAGCSPSIHQTATFSAEGTVEEVIKAYTEWEGTITTSCSGEVYPSRYIFGCDPLLAIHTALNGQTSHLDYLRWKEVLLLPLYEKYNGKRINP